MNARSSDTHDIVENSTVCGASAPSPVPRPLSLVPPIVGRFGDMNLMGPVGSDYVLSRVCVHVATPSILDASLHRSVDVGTNDNLLC